MGSLPWNGKIQVEIAHIEVLETFKERQIIKRMWGWISWMVTEYLEVRVPNGGRLGFFLAVLLPRRGTASNKDRKVNEGSVVE